MNFCSIASSTGLALWDCLILTILTGCLSYFAFFSLFNLLTELLIIVVWIMVHAQVKRRIDEYTTTKDQTDDEGASKASMIESGGTSKGEE